jgi:hypothetical protein
MGDEESGRRHGWRRRSSWAAAAAVVVGLMALAARPAVALNPVPLGGSPQLVTGGPLSPAHPVLTFSQTFTAPTPLPLVSDPLPAVCSPTAFCSEWSLPVATSSPFLVSIHNASPGFNSADGFNLFVYGPDGQMLASADGIGADGQSVAIAGDPAKGSSQPTPGPGTYTIAVTMTYAEDNTFTYRGEARLLTPPSWTLSPCHSAPPCDLLPQLVPVPPSDFHVSGLPPVPSTPLGFPLPVSAPTPNSCYTDETVQTGAQRCLRFTTDVRNSGAGVMELRYDFLGQNAAGQPTSGVLPGGCEATQVVYRSDGSSTTHDAGPCEFHGAHGHFHYKDLVTFSLHPVTPTGLAPAVANSVKESFCLADDDYFGFGTSGPANGQRDYPGVPGCDIPSQVGSSPTQVDGVMGVAPGWGDVYTWDTPDQYLDITNVADGDYAVVEQANPGGFLQVAGIQRPCSSTTIRLSAGAVTVLSQITSMTCP